ncbi:MAG: NAD(P)/FAD-dependent oxidoreductase [Clostridiales bacterium]|nr:NAD(P)/FAD-dependent oxidoreductase [Clostridiales bacterium]
MNIKSVQKKLDKIDGGSFKVSEADNMRIVTGTSGDWNAIISACQAAVSSDKNIHVVNKVKFTGGQDAPMRVPEICDNSLEGEEPDVLIIGGGISGASIAREMSKHKLNILLVEKESDLAMQASGRNDGEVHPGVDLSKGSLKQHYVLLGNRMYGDVCRDLGVPFERCGQYVGFTQKSLKPVIAAYVLMRKNIDGVKDTVLLSGEELHKREPNLNKDFKFAIYNPSAGCVCPYGLTIAYAENAVQNGVRVSLNTAVLGMKVKSEKITEVVTNRGTVYPKIVINAAGVFADNIAEMAHDMFFSIHPRRGTNSILDKKAGKYIHCISSIKKLTNNKSHTKGGGILHTVHGNLLVGPDAVETWEKENVATNPESIDNVFNKQRETSDKISKRDIITYFTGVRAPTFEEDFIIEKGRNTANIIHCAGIQSPGLTTAPAVALDIEKMAVEMLTGMGISVRTNTEFNPKREPIPVLRNMSDEERSKKILENPDYGEIVCRCEEVSKGEIIDALKSPICVPTVDGIKKRVRPGMGRCQGGFCSPAVVKIIAEFTGKNLSDVRKSSESSVILYGGTKEGEADEQ